MFLCSPHSDQCLAKSMQIAGITLLYVCAVMPLHEWASACQPSRKVPVRYCWHLIVGQTLLATMSSLCLIVCLLFIL